MQSGVGDDTYVANGAGGSTRGAAGASTGHRQRPARGVGGGGGAANKLVTTYYANNSQVFLVSSTQGH